MLTCVCCGRTAPDVQPGYATICGVFEQASQPMCTEDIVTCLKNKKGVK